MADPGATVVGWRDRFEVPAGVSRAVVGCSGGPDSSALLVLAVAAGLDVVAVHVDHGLRPGSEAEADVVRATARRLGVPATSVTVAVAPGTGLEARAREARLAVLEEQRVVHGAGAVLLGHTRDDQAETVLLNLLRGSAAAGLGGIPPVRGHLVHPILSLARADTAEICARLGLTTVRDPMNDDVSFRRVWLRREVIPFLEAGTGRDLRELLARQAGLLRAESDFLDHLARRELASDTPDARHLAALDPVVARRVVRLWLGSPPPSLEEVEAVLAVARGDRAAAELRGRTRVERRGDVLHRAQRPAPKLVPFEVPLPGEAEAGGLRVETWVERAAPARWPDGKWVCVLDAERAGERAVVRAATRGGHPVLADAAGEPLWVVGYRVAARARVTPATRRYLWARAVTIGTPST